MSAWYEKTGSDSDIVISTRIRLARNLSDIPFPPKWSDEQAKSVTESIRECVKHSDYDFEFLNIDNTPSLNKEALVEDHLMSREMLSGKNRSLLLDKEGVAAIMIGEEDHIRMQIIKPGFDVYGAYDIADKLDSAIGEKIDYAYHEKFGFLTHCPTNVGTGMRASVMLHLPAMTMANSINSIAGQVGKLGLTIRGVYGEGSASRGDMYQLSNQITLGITEKQACDKLNDVTKQIIKTERELREQFQKRNPFELEDTVYRALGTLKFARKISSKECAKLLSYVKLGTDLGIIKEENTQKIIELMIRTEPAHIALGENKNLSPDERDSHRSQILRSSL